MIAVRTRAPCIASDSFLWGPTPHELAAFEPEARRRAWRTSCGARGRGKRRRDLDLHWETKCNGRSCGANAGASVREKSPQTPIFPRLRNGPGRLSPHLSRPSVVCFPWLRTPLGVSLNLPFCVSPLPVCRRKGSDIYI